MPFGKTGYHSLTAVTFTPHVTSYETLPHFECQKLANGYCSPEQLGNCNYCQGKPQSAWPYMSQMARKYLNPKGITSQLFRPIDLPIEAILDKDTPIIITEGCKKAIKAWANFKQQKSKKLC